MIAFTRFDWLLLLVATALRLADTAMTRFGLAHGKLESNPLLGHHPSLTWNLTYLLATLALLWVVAWWLDGPWRLTWLVGYALVEVWSLVCAVWAPICWVHLFHVKGW